MSKEEPKKMEDIDWDALENEDRVRFAQKEDEIYDEASIEEEKEKLTENEKNSPYPDDFLADINLLNKTIQNNQQNRKPNSQNEG